VALRLTSSSPLQFDQLRAVAQRSHRAHRTAADDDWHPVEHEHAIVAQNDLIRSGHPACECLQQRGRYPLPVQGPADRTSAQTKQAYGFVVDQGHPISPVGADDALLDPAQHGLAMLDQPDDLAGLEA
jgi:hypothetical protein